MTTAFSIGVGVASGSIVETYLRYRARVLQPLVAVSDELSTHLVRPIKGWARRRWSRAHPTAADSDAEPERPE